MIPDKIQFKNQGGTNLSLTPLPITSLVLAAYLMQTCLESASDPIPHAEVKSTITDLQPRVWIWRFLLSRHHHLMTTENASYQLLLSMRIINIIARGISLLSLIIKSLFHPVCLISVSIHYSLSHWHLFTKLSNWQRQSDQHCRSTSSVYLLQQLCFNFLKLVMIQ